MNIKRRTGRERALQLLCSLDLNPPPAGGEQSAAEMFWRFESSIDSESALNPPEEDAPDAAAPLPAQEREFTERLALGAWNALAELDAKIEPFVEHWSLRRLGTVERNVLRLGVWELMDRPETPRAIIVNEAVDLAKYYSTSSAGKFVNGVLDKIAGMLRPDEKRQPRRERAAKDTPDGIKS